MSDQMIIEVSEEDLHKIIQLLKNECEKTHSYRNIKSDVHLIEKLEEELENERNKVRGH